MIGRNNKIKVYMINGFLESGKTEFINFTLEQPYFKAKGTTLLLVCEEGELVYKRAFLRRNNIEMEVIEEEQKFTPERLSELQKKHKAVRVIIEYNGMWNHKNIIFPVDWELEQQVTIIDTSTFGMYYNNMKSMVGEMVRNSELVLFNRADNVKDLATYKRNIKMVNQQAEIVFEGADAEITTVLDEELPYDINAEIIHITDETYGMWFLDTLENTARYENKWVEFIGQVLKRDNFPSNYFVPIRKVMTCCEDDIAQLGFICEYEGSNQFSEGDWVKVTAVIKEEYWADYGGEGPVLHAKTVIGVTSPKNTIIDFK